MKYKISYFLFLTLFFPTTQTLLGNFEFLNDLFYDTSKSYSVGDSVVLESDPSEIFTALIDVPPGNPPAVGTQSQYWSSSDDYTSDLTSNNSDDISTVPSSNFDTTTPGTTPSDGPTFPESTVSVNFSENSTESVATIFANFADSYQISSEKDGSLFILNSSDLQLTFIDSPDYETPSDEDGNNVYEVVIVASSGTSGSTDSQTISVTVENVIEAPVFDDGSSATVEFTSGGTGSVYTASATDGATFSISGGANLSLFSINSATGALSFISSPTYAEGSSNTYSVTITATNSQGSTDLSIIVDLIPEATTSSRFLGISTRGLVSSTKAMYGSIAVTGTENKLVAFMGKGKTMETQGITDYVTDPALIIYKLTNGVWGVYRTIDNWEDATGSESILSVSGKQGITLPVDALEAAIVLNLEPGNYSAILTSTESSEKEALVEAYEIPSENEVSRFLGISTRGLVSSTKAMYGSIAITGTKNKKVAFMGKGKTMEAQGITDYVADPALIIYKLTNGVWGVYRTIDNWTEATGIENISAYAGKEGITLPVSDTEAAIVLDLEPGNYSAILTSTESESKEALVEAYEIVE